MINITSCSVSLLKFHTRIAPSNTTNLNHSESWKNGIVIFQKNTTNFEIFTQTGELEENRNSQNYNYIDCYHGLCTLRRREKLVVCDDHLHIFKFTIQ